ncbi:MAG: serine/threonine protein kinase [Silicimonas sp.]|nr:serine/threonine protein kinase [Silicimonas sp.]
MTEPDIAREAILAEQALPIGTVLSGDQFTITDQLGAGGFGITYRATDNVLGRTVVVKECFYDDYCVRDGKNVVPRNKSFIKPVHSIVSMFMREARSLAKLRHPNIVGVHRAFEENETAYMVLDLIDGRDLFDILATKSTPLAPARVKDILLQMLDAIEKVHELDLLHRDISPDNILIENNGTPVLIDFGAARGDASRRTRALSSLLVVKEGYSPHEFYVPGSEQKPCSDLYALAATFYHVLSGKAPPNSQTRLIEIAAQKPDPCEPLVGRIPGYDDAFLQAIDSAMLIHPGDRLQSASKWRSLIADAEVQPAERIPSKDVSLELELSLSRLVEETNDEVRKSQLVIIEPETMSAPKKETIKPTWIDEFNQGSLATEAESHVQDADDRVEAPGDLNAIDTTEAEAAPKSETIETNWISRAVEKQQRIISEREKELELFELGAIDVAHPSPEKFEEQDDLTAVQEPVPANNSGPTKIIVGLLVGFCSAAFFVVF